MAYNLQSTTTPGLEKAAEATTQLQKDIQDFIKYSKSKEKSNEKLTCFIIGLTVIQAISAIIEIYQWIIK